MYLLQETSESLMSGIELFDRLSQKFFIRLIIDMTSVFVLIRLIYFPNYRNKEFFFTFFIFNLIIFLVTFLMNKVEMSIGAAFGLFAVFGILRYRIEDISIKSENLCAFRLHFIVRYFFIYISKLQLNLK